MNFFALFLLAAHAVHAVKLSWYISTGCKGEFLHEEEYDGSVLCEPIPDRAYLAESMVITFDGPNDDDLEVLLWGTEDCFNVLDVHRELTCVADDDDEIKGYTISWKRPGALANEPVAKRSPGDIQRGLDTIRANAEGTEVGAPKHYDIDVSNSSLALSQKIPANHPYISATAWTVTHLLSWSSLVTGCVGVGDAGPVSGYSCAASIAATSISFVMAALNVYEGAKAFHATMRNNNVEIGLRRPGKRGIDGAPERMTISHEEYMEYILHQAGFEGQNIGKTRRDEDIETPAYKFTGRDGQDYIFTIRRGEGDEVAHSISFGHDTNIEKRQGYEGVRVNGGVDIQACQRTKANADWDDLPFTPASAYDYIYDDLRCLIGSDQLLGSSYLSTDVMDKDGDVLLTIGMTPFKKGTPYEVATRPPCDDTEFYFSSTCMS